MKNRGRRRNTEESHRRLRERTGRPGSDFLKATGIKPEWLEAATTLLRGTGCPKCQGKGYIGRKAIFEALIVDQEIERAIAQKKSPRDIRNMMTARGEKTLFEQAVGLAAAQTIWGC